MPEPPRYKMTQDGAFWHLTDEDSGWVLVRIRKRHPDPERAATEECARLEDGYYDKPSTVSTICSTNVASELKVIENG